MHLPHLNYLAHDSLLIFLSSPSLSVMLSNRGNYKAKLALFGKVTIDDLMWFYDFVTLPFCLFICNVNGC